MILAFVLAACAAKTINSDMTVTFPPCELAHLKLPRCNAGISGVEIKSAGYVCACWKHEDMGGWKWVGL